MIRILLAVLLCFSVSAFANGEKKQQQKFYKLQYIVEPNDNLAKIFKRFVFLNSVITRTSLMTKKTFSANPHVDDWKKLVPGTLLTLYIAYEYMDLSKYQAYIKEQKDAIERIQNFGDENTLSNYLPVGLKASLFYMASNGRFTQKDSKTAEVEFYQNSPVTLGTSLSYYPENSLWSFSGSAYASYLIAAANNLDDKNVNVPPEIGANFYNEYRFENYNFTGYFGLDYERFSTFNMGGIQKDKKVILDQNSTVYATVGVSKLAYIFDSPFFTKLSFSKSLSSTIDSNPDGLKSSGAYEGYKMMWYLNKKVSQKFYIHTLLKYHWMDGPSELTTLRVGLGFGYIIK